MLLQVTCQECGAAMSLVASDEVEKRIATGQYVNGQRLRKGKNSQGDNNLDTYDEAVFGICAKCQRLAELQADSKGSDRAADAQTIRIRMRLAIIRERRQDLTLEQAVAAAVEAEFDPHHEANRDFRAYLLGEGAPKDADVDAAAREFVAQLDGPHPGGAA